MASDNGSAEWWRDRLLKRYREVDLPQRALNAAYYDSVNDAPEALTQYADAYKRLLAMSKTPWGRLVVDIVADRLGINGVRIGEDAKDNNETTWQALRRNRVEALQRQLYPEALALGTSYVSVWNDEETERPKLAFESGMAVTHETKPGDPHSTAAAIKVWHDPIQELVRCNLYLPERVVKYASNTKVTEQSWTTPGTNGLTQVTKWDVVAEVENPHGIVPIVPFVVRPNWEGYGTSDLEDLRPIIARIEHLTANILLAVELGAFRVRWATGLDIPKDPETDKPLEPFKVAMDRLWTSADPETKFGSFDSTDIRPYLQAISDAIGQLSSVSRIPTLYFNQSELSNPPSAASLEATEVGLVKRVLERQDRFGESWETVVKLMNRQEEEVSVTWRDARTRSEAQSVDAAVKLHTVGFPFKGLLEYLGYSPTEVKRLEQMRSADTFQRMLENPLAAANQGRPVPPGQEQPQEEPPPPEE